MMICMKQELIKRIEEHSNVASKFDFSTWEQVVVLVKEQCQLLVDVHEYLNKKC
jgi:hypothetical protein